MTQTSRPNDLEAFWMPFTANRQFKAAPRLFASAKDMYYQTPDGREVLDGTSGLWCVNAGHCRPPIVEAIQQQVATLDFAGNFQMGHPKAFECASRLVDVAPDGFDHVFFTNSGSESVDTALKMALAYQHARGKAEKIRLIGRERAYHGVNFGGMAVGGIGANRNMFAPLVTGVDHIRHTHDLSRNAFSKGEPEHGAEWADDLERLIALHDASSIAAVIVEPVACSTGVLVPPKGYLKRLEALCRKHDILLIADEVITAFGRLGKMFASDYFDISPDIVTIAKGVTNGTIPMGAVFMKSHIFDAFQSGPPEAIDFAHGYTYSGHPVAAAAALATLDVHRDEALADNVADLAGYWEERAHALRELPYVIDIRNIGLIAAIEFQPVADQPSKRAYDRFVAAFESGLLVRHTGDVIALSPPLIISKAQIDELFDKFTDILKNTP